MSSDEMRFHVRVDPERVDIRVLESSIAAFARLVRASGAEKWTVSDLRLASITAAVRPREGVDVDAEFARLTAGLATLGEPARPPSGWTDDMLESVADLRKLIETEGVQGVDLTFGQQPAIAVSSDVVRNAAAAVARVPRTLGAVTGKVERFHQTLRL
ncbi:hypothetical protein [Cellulomonas hominis]